MVVKEDREMYLWMLLVGIVTLILLILVWGGVFDKGTYLHNMLFSSG